MWLPPSACLGAGALANRACRGCLHWRGGCGAASGAAAEGCAGKRAARHSGSRRGFSPRRRPAPPAGADIPGSLFDPDLKGWSLRRLRSLLSDTLEAHGIRMPGVNEPYLYVGSWRSLFAW